MPNPDIPDDTKTVEPIFRELKQNFKSGATKTAQFRKQALRRLHQGLE